MIRLRVEEIRSSSALAVCLRKSREQYTIACSAGTPQRSVPADMEALKIIGGIYKLPALSWRKHLACPPSRRYAHSPFGAALGSDPGRNVVETERDLKRPSAKRAERAAPADYLLRTRLLHRPRMARMRNLNPLSTRKQSALQQSLIPLQRPCNSATSKPIPDAAQSDTAARPADASTPPRAQP